jgi:DNA (cytosine-5)-methyltransferase 1
MHVVDNFSGVAQARKAMDIDWMMRDELREAIPPAYAKFIGEAAMAHIRQTQNVELCVTTG